MSEDLNSKYGLNPAHSEIVAALELVQPGKVLDMGCSNGRNALYLSQHGFDVTAVDENPQAIEMLQTIAGREGLDNIEARIYDLNDAAIESSYDFIACTVTLMFLDPDKIEAVLHNMQEQTNAGGYNLIVCAMDTADYPCPMNFPFTFAEGELKQAYEGWELLKYNEDVGTMHNGAQLRFATMLARKAS